MSDQSNIDILDTVIDGMPALHNASRELRNTFLSELYLVLAELPKTDPEAYEKALAQGTLVPLLQARAQPALRKALRDLHPSRRPLPVREELVAAAPAPDPAGNDEVLLDPALRNELLSLAKARDVRPNASTVRDIQWLIRAAIEDESASAIAESSGVEPTVVRQALSRARRFLRAQAARLLSNRPAPPSGPVPSKLQEVHERYMAGEMERANEALQAIRDAHRRDPHWYRYATMIHRKLGKLPEALSFGTIGLQFADDPGTRWKMLSNVASVFADLGMFDEAASHLERAAALAPDEILPHTNLMAIWCRADRFSYARAQFHLNRVIDIASGKNMSVEQRADLVEDLTSNPAYAGLRRKQAWQRAQGWLERQRSKATRSDAATTLDAGLNAMLTLVFVTASLLGIGASHAGTPAAVATGSPYTAVASLESSPDVYVERDPTLRDPTLRDPTME